MQRYLLLIFILLSGISKANEDYQHVIDSIIASVESSEDTNKIIAYNYLSYYLRNHNVDLAIEHADKAILLSKKAESDYLLAEAYEQFGLCQQSKGDYPLAQDYYKKTLEIYKKLKNETGVAGSLNDLGVSYYYMGQYEKALEYFVKSAEMKVLIGDSIGAAQAYNNTGIMYDIAGKPGKAVEYYLKALKIYEGVNRPDLMMGTILNIGIIYSDQKNYDEALKYYQEGVRLGIKIGDKTNLITAYNNVGIAYDKKQMYDSALAFYNKSFELSKKIGFKKGIAIAYNNMAINYEGREDYDKSIEYYLLALPLKIEMGDKSSIAITQLGLGDVYSAKGDQKTAIEYFTKGLKNAQKTSYILYIQQAYSGLSRSYGRAAKYKEAYEYQTLFVALKDSLLNEENTKIINELNTKYETVKKDKMLAIMTKDKELQDMELKRKRTIQYATTAALVLMLLLVFVVFRGYQQKKKANEVLNTKNEEIAKQRDEITEQKKELTDSIDYAKNIQQAILPHQEDISHALPEHFILYLPKNVVSGDFYWFAERDNKAFIAACDCTGHGVPGAFVSMIGNNLLNQIILEKEVTDPGQVLSELNKGIKGVFTKHGEQEAQDGMDMTLCVFDLNSNKMEFAAANNPVFLLRKGVAASGQLTNTNVKLFGNDLAIVSGDRTPIGGYTILNHAFKSHNLDLQKNDMIYIFSDGYQDQFGGDKGKKFMIKRLKELLVTFQEIPVAEQKEKLQETIEGWRGKTEQIDDILVIGIRV